MKKHLSLPRLSCFSKLLTTTESCTILDFAPLPFSCSTFQGFGYEEAVRRRHQCHQSGWRTYLPYAEHGEPYAYQPLRNYTLVQEQARMWLHLVASTDFRLLRTWSDCRACLWMLLSSIVTRGIWWSHGLFAVTLSSLFHGFTVLAGSMFLYCTPSEVDTLFILSTFLIHTSRYTSNTIRLRACCQCSLPTQTQFRRLYKT